LRRTCQPAQQRRNQELLVDVLQQRRHAAGQVVVEQHGAGIEAFQAEPAAFGADALQRFQHQLLAVGQVERGRLR
jgi:hypothetical protein